ncbi:hypothetical protein FH972_024634 [Carpinus fangiana]|uniref:Nucleoside phosphorylase domain-containing protein n=1 Tax=Carpinus fangiana TaxID=176857 RepID=A0A5N6KYW4_9ROSI|nr:hypothetical protein FH972_024634 [Carpinus fangiana]
MSSFNTVNAHFTLAPDAGQTTVKLDMDVIKRITVGWICALPHELAASTAMLDEDYGLISLAEEGDDGNYRIGTIGAHMIAMRCLPSGSIGTDSAATVGTNMKRSFQHLQFVFMVGIGAGNPNPKYDIHLGDVVVSKPTGTSGGIFQYDFGKALPDGSFEFRGHMPAPPRAMLDAVQWLQEKHEKSPSRIPHHVEQMMRKTPTLRPKYSRPATEFSPQSRIGNSELVDPSPRIHYGIIASGNKIITDAKERDRLCAKHEILCFEMEAAGLMHTFPCLIVRGISDFADSEKNDEWQRHAAANAAAYTKELLAHLPGLSSSPLLNPNPAIPTKQMLMKYPRDVNFVGREKILLNVRRRIESATGSPRIALVGLGGVGFEELARKLKLPGLEDPKPDYLKIFYRWLDGESSGRWLMVLDNANDASFARNRHRDANDMHPFKILPHLPQTSRGAILVTSRHGDAASALVGPSNIVTVNPMSRLEALQLLDQRIQRKHGSESERCSLVDAIGNFPLAITQAASYITSMQGRTISGYLRQFENNEETQSKLLELSEYDDRRDMDLPNSVVSTIQINIKEIKAKNRLAFSILVRMSMFDRQKIPEAILGRNSHKNKEGKNSSPVTDFDFEEAERMLLGFSLVTPETGVLPGRSFQMHTLVKIAIRTWQPWVTAAEDAQRERCIALRNLAEVYPWHDHDYNTQVACRTLEPHAEMLLKYKHFRALEPLSEEELLYRAEILYKRSDYISCNGEHLKAKNLAEKSLSIRGKVLGQEHRDTLASLHQIALIYRKLHSLEEAERSFLNITKIQKRKYGLGHPDILFSLQDLATVYHAQGRLTLAEALAAGLADINKKLLGEWHQETSLSRISLAYVQQDRGSTNDAEKLYTDLLGHGQDSPSYSSDVLLACRSNLAKVYMSQGKIPEAQRLHMEVLTAERASLGEEHPYNLNTMAHLAIIHGAQGQMEEAERLESQTMGRRDDVCETWQEFVGSEAILSRPRIWRLRHGGVSR